MVFEVEIPVSEKKEQGVLSQVAQGASEAFRQQFLDGPQQLSGQKVDLSYAHDDTTAESIGKFGATSAIFVGATVLAKRIPVVGTVARGALATTAVGGTLGFLTPVREDQGLNERLINGGIGAATMGILEFGPGLIGKMPKLGGDSLGAGLTRAAGSNGLAGFIHTEGNSVVNNGRLASWDEVALGTGTWMATGSAFHMAGRPFAKWQAERADAKALYAGPPQWQFKSVQQIRASDLQRGQQLAPGHYEVGFQSQGHARSFDLYVSEGATAGTQSAPVVTFLHGLNPKGQSQKIIRELNYNKFADEDGAVVAYLHARDGRHGPLTGNSQNWNDPKFGYTKYDPSYSDQVAFADMMGIIRRHIPNANTDNIAVTVFSLGGKLANRLAATRTDVSTVATIHGTVDRFDEAMMKASEVLRPKKAMFVLGTDDAVLPYRDGKGGKSFFTMLLENSGLSRPGRQAQFWSEVNGSGTPLTTVTPNYTRTDWGSASGDRVTQFVVNGGAHAIDGAPPKKNLIQFFMGAPKPADYFDARQRTWDFVMEAIRRNTERTAARVTA